MSASIRAFVSCFAVLGFALGAVAQVQISLRGVPSKVRQGEVVRAQIRITGARQSGEPKLPKVSGMRLSLGGRRLQQSYVNGAFSVELLYDLEIMPQRVGKLSLPAIKVRVGSQEMATRPRVVEVVRNVTGADFGSLAVRLNKKRVYVHETVAVEVSCGVSRELQLASDLAPNGQKYYRVFVESDWLGEPPFGELVETTDTNSDREERIALNRVLQRANVDSRQKQSLFRFVKTILPTKPGVYQLDGPTMRFSVVQGSSRRDLFGRPLQTTRDYVVAAEAAELEVVALPVAGRPEPFYGGVGEFSIRAAFDKASVQVGGSVKLILTISGRGNMEQFQVPALTSLPGFHALGNIENRNRERVAVTYDLSPKSVEVSAVPPISWNYFDTKKGVYVTLATDPVSVTVTPRVGEKSLSDLPTERPDTVVAGEDDIHDVWIAAEVPSPRFAGAPGVFASVAAVVGPWVVCLLGLVFVGARRRSLADVQGRRARGALRKFEATVAAEPLDALVGYLADRLGCEPAAVIGPDLADRLVAAGVEEADARDAASLVDSGVAARYGGGGGVEPSEATRVVQTLEAAPSGLRGGASASLLLCALLCGASSVSGADSGYNTRSADSVDSADSADSVDSADSADSAVRVASADAAGTFGAAFADSTVFAPAATTHRALGNVERASRRAGGQQAGAVPADVSAAEAAYRRGDYVEAAAGFRAAAAAGDRRAAYNLGNCLFRQGLYARALVAYERARRAMPRDVELLANIKLTRERLETGAAGDESFFETVARARESFTPMERLWACLILNCLAAALVCFGGRRLRWVGILCAVPGLILAVELLVLLPQRSDRGIIVAPEAQVRAEPNESLDPLLRVRAGAGVEFLGRGGGNWSQVRVRGRKGWVPASAVERIE